MAVLCLLISLSHYKPVAFYHLFSPMFMFLCFCLVVSLFKTVPMHSAEVPLSCPMLKKAVSCLMGKSICVLDKLCSDKL